MCPFHQEQVVASGLSPTVDSVENGVIPIPASPQPQSHDATSLPTLPLRPTHLPSVYDVELEFEDALQGVPLPFILSKIRSRGAELLHGADCTRPVMPTTPDLPNEIQCNIVYPSPSLLLPSHLLAIRFSDSTQGTLVPIHGLAWALQSPRLHFLSRSPTTNSRSPAPHDETQGQTSITLPVVEVDLPVASVFGALHEYIYTGSSSDLITSLTSFPIQFSSSLQRSIPITSLSERGSPPKADLRHRLELIQGLWRSFVALEIDDKEAWTAMEEAWKTIMAEYDRLLTLP